MQKIIDYIKTHRWAYNMFYYIGTFAIRFFSIFIRIDNKKVLFVSFGGKKFDDSPKAIYQQMCEDKFFDDYNFVWAFRNPETFDIGARGVKIKIDTIKFVIEALRSKIWVTNSSVERGLSFKKKATIMINTWHGTPLKKICQEENSASKGSFQTKDGSHIDIMTAQGQHDAAIFVRLFNVNAKDILQCDLPRNDVLTQPANKDELKAKIGIPQNKKVLLYAPTYREYERDKDNACVLNIPIDFEKWQRRLGDGYIILLRAHYEVVKVLNMVAHKNVIDVSSYPTLSDLMQVSDLLISDYSSMFFDYCITGKPMLCYAYDLEEYLKNRGLYLDIDQSLPCKVAKSEDELLDQIEHLDEKQAQNAVEIFKAKFAPNAGHATKAVINKLIDVLNSSSK